MNPKVKLYMPSKHVLINTKWHFCLSALLFFALAILMYVSYTLRSLGLERLAARAKCRFRSMWSLLYFVAALFAMTLSPAFAAPDLKAKVAYNLELNNQLKLRVTKIPTEFGMIDLDANGQTVVPKIGSVIVTETTEDLHINDDDYSTRVIPAGTKFYARILSISPEQKFQKDGSVNMEFFKFELPSHKQIYLRDQALQADTSVKHSKLRKALTVGAYSVAGVVAAPVVAALGLGLSGNIISLSAGATPYIYGAAAVLGGGIGLAYGLMHKGTMQRVEPGTEITVKPSDKWQLSMSNELPTLDELNKSRKQEEDLKSRIANDCSPGADCPQDPQLLPVVLNIVKIKKTSDLYGSPCLKINFDFKNNTKEKLRYSSIVLVDSMGREYEASPISADVDFIGELPPSATLVMNFATEFPKSVHYLQVRSLVKRKVLASVKVVLR